MSNMKELAAILRGLTPQQTSELSAELGLDKSTPTPRTIRTILSEMGAPAANKGYEYVVTATLLILERPERLDALTTKLYPMVAKEHNSTPSRVERAIRHEVECIMDNNVLPAFQEKHPDFQMAVPYDKGKPTNGEFLATMYQFFRE